jgi:hypothetical protein
MRRTVLAGPGETKRRASRRRIQSPATLAENATEAVDQIIWESRRFYLREPIDLTIERKGPYWFIGYEPLGIKGYGRDEQEALQSFADVFSATWDGYAAESTRKLSADARELKQRLLHLVAEIGPS